MAKMIYGVFDDRASAEAAVSELMSSGVTRDDLSVVAKNSDDARAMVDNNDNVADSTKEGVVTGGAVGALAGLLIGLSVITLPPIGGIVIAGPLAAALGISTTAASTVAGAGIGALTGGLVGALKDVGVPEDIAADYESRIAKNGVLVGINCDSDEETRAHRAILERNGAQNIHETN